MLSLFFRGSLLGLFFFVFFFLLVFSSKQHIFALFLLNPFPLFFIFYIVLSSLFYNPSRLILIFMVNNFPRQTYRVTNIRIRNTRTAIDRFSTIWNPVLRLNKKEFLQSCAPEKTNVCLHYLNSNKTPREKVRLERYKSARCHFKQILEAASHEAASVWPIAIHLTYNPKKRHNGPCGRNKFKLISDDLR